MVDLDTFLTTLYVMVDDFCKSQLPSDIRPGPQASLSRSEVVTLALMSQWYYYRNQRDFYRYAKRRLRSAFRRLPDRSQFNRLVRDYRDAIVAFGLYLVEEMRARYVEYEILDTTGVPVRNIKRRGRGWLVGMANIGKCTRLGWYNGFRLLIAVNPEGVITGFGFGEGSAKEQPLAETMLAQRCQAQAAIPSVGRPALGWYFADMGFAGDMTHERWRIQYGAEVITEPQVNSPMVWPKAWRYWLHSFRQIVETVYGKLMGFFRLNEERPHDLTGFQADLAAKVALHNFCIWLNKQLGRAPLAFADLLNW
jgi:Transposase DDE domain